MVIYVKGRNNNGPFKSDPKFTETKKKTVSSKEDPSFCEGLSRNRAIKQTK